MRTGGSIRGVAAALAAGVTLLVAAPAEAALTLVPAYTDSSAAPVSTPIYVTAPPADQSRLFVVERGGRIRVAVDGVMKDTPFLDISSRVQTSGEGGLLSMAFAPDYATSRKFYVYFVQKSDGHIRVEQYTRSIADANVADITPTQMLDVAHPTFDNHYGGQIAFGPNGLLYAGTGDGGSGGDPPGNAQNPSSQLGKLLAIDTSGPTVTTAALGLRNPFRFSFDRTSGDLVLGDVGQDQWEEVDWVPATDTLLGSNFGWNCWEANNHRTPGCDPASYVPPVIAYPNPNGSAGPQAAVTGGVVVRDPALTSLFGRYLYADFYAGRVHSAQLAKPVTDDRVESEVPLVSQLVAFGEDAAGRVYVVSLGGGASTGVRRIVCVGTCDQPGTSGGGGGAGSGSGGGAVVPPADTSGSNAPPQAVPTVRDTSPPALRVRAAHRQDVLGRASVRLSVVCDERCLVRATGTARGLALRGTMKRLEPGKRQLFELGVSKRLRRALARRGVVSLSVRGRDAAGNLRTASLTIRVKRG